MATITLDVNTKLDQNDGYEGDGLSLREAILKANADPTNEYIINLPGLPEGESYDLDLQNILDAPIVDVTSIDLPTLIESRLTTGDLDVKGNVTIIGEDPENTIINALPLQNTFMGRLSSLPVAPLTGEENDPIPGNMTDSKLIRVTRDGVEQEEIVSPNPPIDYQSYSPSPFIVGDRVFDVGSNAELQLENVNLKNGLLITEKEIILNVTDNEIYTRIYDIPKVISVDVFDQKGDPVLDEDGNQVQEIVETTERIVETYELTGVVISQADIDEGGTINIGNFDTTPEGAGLKIDQGSSVILNNVVIEDNSTESIAGGIDNNGNLNIKDSTIQNNSARSAGGIRNNGNLTINRTTIQNHSSGLGTGVHNFGSVEIYNSLIAYNSAGSSGLRFGRAIAGKSSASVI